MNYIELLPSNLICLCKRQSFQAKLPDSRRRAVGSGLTEVRQNFEALRVAHLVQDLWHHHLWVWHPRLWFKSCKKHIIIV